MSHKLVCVIILKTVLVNAKHHIVLETSEYHRSLHVPAEHKRHRHFVWLWPGQCLLRLVSSLLMLVETSAGLTTGMDGHGSCPACASIPQSPIGGPNKGVHYTPLAFRGQCPLRGLWLLTCHITNTILIFRAAGRIIWTWRLCNGRP